MKPKKPQLKQEYDIPLNPFGKLFKYLHDIITDRTVEFQYDNKTDTLTVINQQVSKPHIAQQKFDICYDEENQLFTIFIIVSFDTFNYPIPHQPVRVITELHHAIDRDHNIAQLAHMIHYYMDTNNIPTIN